MEPSRTRWAHLATLRISLDRSRESPSQRGEALFTLDVAGRETRVFRVSLESLGLPSQLEEIRGYRYDEPAFRIPPAIVESIEHMLAGGLPPGDPLWLVLEDPSASLACIPWEALLQPVLEVPLLRLPYYALEPPRNVSKLDIVVCASSPIAKTPFPTAEYITTAVSAILAPMAPLVTATCHVFTDAPAHERLTATSWPRTPWGDVQLYDPDQAPDYDIPERTSSIREATARLENPWLRWIADTLSDRAVDVVLFMGHGYLAVDQGAIALAESPRQNRDERMARFVGARQLTLFLNQLGAWSVGFSALRPNFSMPGLRLLANQLARSRPGLVWIDETTQPEPPHVNSLASAFQFLHGPGHAPPWQPWFALWWPLGSRITAYCHPVLVHEEWATGKRAQLESYLRSVGRSAGRGAESQRPAWIAASERYLEQIFVQAFEIEELSHRSSAVQQGTSAALSFLADAIARYAR